MKVLVRVDLVRQAVGSMKIAVDVGPAPEGWNVDDDGIPDGIVDIAITKAKEVAELACREGVLGVMWDASGRTPTVEGLEVEVEFDENRPEDMVDVDLSCSVKKVGP